MQEKYRAVVVLLAALLTACAPDEVGECDPEAALELVYTADGVPAVVSGAGPTVLAFTDGPEGPTPRAVLGRTPQGWWSSHLAVDTSGATVRPSA